jgi:hypothetical protein
VPLLQRLLSYRLPQQQPKHCCGLLLQLSLSQQAQTAGSSVRTGSSCCQTSLSQAAAAAELPAPLSGTFWALLLLLLPVLLR